MAKFNPSVLKPAFEVEAFAKNPSNQRTVQQIALDNVAKMKEQFQAGDGAEGKKNFTIAGEQVSFTIRVSNTALVLETAEVKGTQVEVKEMSAPTAAFLEALDYYADRIKAGEYDAQLAALSDKKAARTARLQATRAAKSEDKKAA